MILDQREEIEILLKNKTIIDRELDIKEIRKFLKYPNILAILGVRRCGKSVLSHLIFKGTNYGYINFDDERLVGMKANDLNLILEAFYALYGSNLENIILDEIQNIDCWKLFATRLRISKKVIITGSNSKFLSGELATHLTGRHIDLLLFPFSFREYLQTKNLKLTKEDLYSTRTLSQIKKHFEEYIKLGGFPETSKFGPRIVSAIYGDILNKDIIFRHDVKHKSTLKELTRYLVSNYTKEITFSNIKNTFQIKDAHTIKNYIDYSNESFITFILERFSFKLKRYNIAPKKVYCIDNGIINSISLQFSENIGRLMENLVAVELLGRKSYFDPDTEIFYWKDHQQREVDFVVKKGKDIEELIHVTYASSIEEIDSREEKSLVNVSKELKCRNLKIITWDYKSEKILNNNKILFIPIWEWLIG